MNEKTYTITLDDHESTNVELDGAFFRATISDSDGIETTATIYAWTDGGEFIGDNEFELKTVDISSFVIDDILADFTITITQEEIEEVKRFFGYYEKHALESIMTATEVEQTFGLAEGTVRQYLKNHANDWDFHCRKSGATWLIPRSEAKRIWGKRKAES
jgi:hypothetical protein